MLDHGAAGGSRRPSGGDSIETSCRLEHAAQEPNATLSGQVFDIPNAQRESMVQANGMTDYLGRKSVTAAREFSCAHGDSVPKSAVKVTVPPPAIESDTDGNRLAGIIRVGRDSSLRSPGPRCDRNVVDCRSVPALT